MKLARTLIIFLAVLFIMPLVSGLGSVTNLIPANGTLFDITASNEVEIAADISFINTTDTVFANITLPNGTVEQLTLSNASGPLKFNNTFVFTNLLGLYEVRIIANSSINDLNDTEITIFEVFRDPLSVDILLPVDGTVFGSPTGIDISLNTSDALFPCLRSLDGGVTNSTMSCTVPTTFNAPGFGVFTLTVFANNATTTVSDSVVFFVSTDTNVVCDSVIGTFGDTGTLLGLVALVAILGGLVIGGLMLKTGVAIEGPAVISVISALVVAGILISVGAIAMGGLCGT